MPHSRQPLTLYAAFIEFPDTVPTVRRVITPIASLAVLGLLISNQTTRPLSLTLLALLLMIGIHELGHFLVAKHFGLAAPEFSLGFGPRILQTSGARTGTMFSLRMIPLGGFVRIRGMDIAAEGADTQDELVAGKSYTELGPYRKAAVAVAGPLANIFSGFLLLFAVFLFLGQQVWAGSLSPAPSSPAAVAGITPQDKILSIDGKPLAGYEDLTAIVIKAYESDNSLNFELLGPAGDTRSIKVKPVLVEGRPRIGVTGVFERDSISAVQALSSAVNATGRISQETLHSFGGLGSAFINIPQQLITGEGTTNRVVSPVGMSKVAESSAERDGWVAPVALFAAVSFFVAFFNLLPLPPLDGFHIFQSLYEHLASKVRRRQVRLDPTLVGNFTKLVMVCVLFLGVGAILLDIIRPISSSMP